MINKIDFQTNFLKQLAIQQIPLTVFLISGVQIRGKLISHDDFTITIDQGRIKSLIYKHQISTIVPIKSIELMR